MQGTRGGGGRLGERVRGVEEWVDGLMGATASGNRLVGTLG